MTNPIAHGHTARKGQEADAGTNFFFLGGAVFLSTKFACFHISSGLFFLYLAVSRRKCSLASEWPLKMNSPSEEEKAGISQFMSL